MIITASISAICAICGCGANLMIHMPKSLRFAGCVIPEDELRSWNAEEIVAKEPQLLQKIAGTLGCVFVDATKALVCASCGRELRLTTSSAP